MYNESLRENDLTILYSPFRSLKNYERSNFMYKKNKQIHEKIFPNYLKCEINNFRRINTKPSENSKKKKKNMQHKLQSFNQEISSKNNEKRVNCMAIIVKAYA